MRVDVDIRSSVTGADVGQATRKAIAMTSEQALKDCNYYCKQDTGALIQSSLIHSDIDGGVLKWVTPYAVPQYTFPSARRDKNPHASPEWCAVAEANHKDQWERVFANTHREEMNRNR